MEAVQQPQNLCFYPDQRCKRHHKLGHIQGANRIFFHQRRHTQHIEVRTHDTPFFSITLKEKDFAFPIHTALLPFPLLQEKDGRYYLTKFTGKGNGRFAGISDLKINPGFFPDITIRKPLIAISVSPFSICFPAAEIIDKVNF